MNECRCKWEGHVQGYTDEQRKEYQEKYPYAWQYFRECPGEDKMEAELEEAREAWHMLLFVPINAGASGATGSLNPGEKWKDTRVSTWERLQAARSALETHRKYSEKSLD